MNREADRFKETAVKFFSVTGLIILSAYLIYGSYIFNVTIRWSQFFTSGITAGLAYAFFSSGSKKDGAAFLILWYLIFTLVLTSRNLWAFVLCGVYILFISAGVYLYLLILKRYSVSNRGIRFIISGLLLGIVNALILLTLTIISRPVYMIVPDRITGFIIINFRIGAELGLLFGIGTELADYAVKMLHTKEVTENL